MISDQNKVSMVEEEKNKIFESLSSSPYCIEKTKTVIVLKNVKVIWRKEFSNTLGKLTVEEYLKEISLKPENIEILTDSVNVQEDMVIETSSHLEESFIPVMTNGDILWAGTNIPITTAELIQHLLDLAQSKEAQ